MNTNTKLKKTSSSSSNFIKTGEVPDFYTCGNCGAGGVRLYRKIGDFSPKLKCVNCVAQALGTDLSEMDEEGCFEDTNPLNRREKTNEIGNFIPAKPHFNGSGKGFYPCNSAPEQVDEWWINLPLFGFCEI